VRREEKSKGWGKSEEKKEKGGRGENLGKGMGEEIVAGRRDKKRGGKEG